MVVINGVTFEVGAEYLISGIQNAYWCMEEGTLSAVLLSVCEASSDCLPYIELDVSDMEEVVELWLGRTQYFTKDGWHGVEDLRTDPDAPGAVVLKK